MALLIKELFDLQLEQHALEDKSKHWYASKDREWCTEAQRRMDALFALIEAWDTAPVEPVSTADQITKLDTGRAPQPRQGAVFFQPDPREPPKPLGALRVTSEI